VVDLLGHDQKCSYKQVQFSTYLNVEQKVRNTENICNKIVNTLSDQLNI
jgi:hypothetical protein